MKKRTKILCLLLTVLLLLGSLSATAFAAKAKNEVPVLFVAGFMSTNTIDKATGEQLFPPSGELLKAAAKEAIKPVLKNLRRGQQVNLKYPLNELVLRLFDGIRCDEDGVPVNDHADTAYTRPSKEEILEKYHKGVGYTAEDPIYYSYDWRLDLQTLAGKLHDFIEYVRECTGAKKVKIIAHSMGTCVTSTYLYLYGNEYLDSAVFYMGALNGSGFCGDPFENNLGMDAESMMAVINAMTGTDLRGELIKAVADILYQQGFMDIAETLSEKLVTELFDRLYAESMPYIFGRIPGFWALIPADSYDTVRNEFSAGVVSDVFYEKVDFYHNVQLHLNETLQKAIDDGLPLSVVVKYGYPLMPIVNSRNNDSDFVVDVKYSSLGATCANYNETLPETYVQQRFPEKNYISPDRKIDASTCAFPDQTWFIKNSTHIDTIAGKPETTVGEQKMLQWILCADGQPTVWDNPDYPQYMVYLADGSLAPLTAENDCSILGNTTRGATFRTQMQRILQDLRRICTLMLKRMGLG